MTREEKIRLTADKYCLDEYTRLGFVAGAEWADSHPHWISVEDELPKDYEPVLAAFANHFARVCFHCGETWYLNKPLAAEEMEGITHWMPLPAPPSCSEFPNNCEKGGEE